jgi:kynurenine formamidase
MGEQDIRRGAVAQEAWGKWGADDQRGALNHAGPDQARRAAGLVRSGQVFTLGQPLSAKTPVPSFRTPMMHMMNRDGGDYAAGTKAPGGFQFAEDTVVMPLQFGTHIDALCHCWYDNTLYNGFSANGTRSMTRAARCGAEHLGPVVTRGLLFDVARHRGRLLDMGETIPLAELQACAEAAGFAPEPGDAVLIRTGWQEQHGRDGATFFEGEPGIDADGALWLAEAGVSLVGADNYAVETIPFPQGTFFPVHQRLIRDYGVPLLEGLELKDLAAAGATQFLFMASPLPIVGATGSPLSPVAVL